MVQVKICGITRLVDAEAAVEWGVHALGFVFAKSPRQISPRTAKEISRRLPPFVKTVGVFVNETPSAIREIRRFCGLDLVQLHGDETVATCDELEFGVIKAIRVQGEKTLAQIAPYKNHVKAILLDTYQKGVRGGTGKTLDWQLAMEAQKAGIPTVLAGGLGPQNIQEAMARVNPSAVDVSSGVEERPGVKDHQKIQSFMEEVHDFGRGMF